jgi:transposase-like protein
MQKQTKSRALQNIMRKHAKAKHIQKRQSALLMCFAENDHKRIAQLLQTWLSERAE